MNGIFDNVFEAEYAIQQIILKDNNCSAHFEYTVENYTTIRLNLVTYNPIHKTFFLLLSISSKSNKKINIITKMYEHISILKSTLSNNNSQYVKYNIEWYCEKIKTKIVSVFYGRNLEQILMKFNYGREKPLKIYSLNLITLDSI